MNKPAHPLPLPLPEDLTERHISAVLAIIHGLHPYLLEPHRDSEDVLRARPDLDGGAAVAATNTFVKACARLDSILDDPERFNLKKLDDLYALAKRVWEGQAEFQEAQRDASRAIQRPCYTLKPEILALDDGTFVAYWGDILNGQGVLGRGATPKEAYADFDAAWSRQAKDQIKLDPATPPVIPSKTPTKRSRKK